MERRGDFAFLRGEKLGKKDLFRILAVTEPTTITDGPATIG